MLKAFSHVLVLCALLSVATVVALLLYNRNSQFADLPRAYLLENGSSSISKSLLENLDWLFDRHSRDFMAGNEVGEGAANTTLEPCPDESPDLIGPFSVEFDHTRTWNEVRRKISAPLRDGGRHNPTSCVSKHKVATPSQQCFIDLEAEGEQFELYCFSMCTHTCIGTCFIYT